MLTHKLMRLTLVGGSEWVMMLLLVLSVVSLSVIVERAMFFNRHRRRLDRLRRLLASAPGAELLSRLRDVVRQDEDLVLRAALDADDGAAEEKQQIVASALDQERLRLQRRLTFLGTLGNNAPFIGLFGTVLGIIRAFHDLSLGTQGGSSAVMAGISEALVATAIGLFVALPAVMAFNYFQRQADHAFSTTEALARRMLCVTGSGTR